MYCTYPQWQHDPPGYSCWSCWYWCWWCYWWCWMWKWYLVTQNEGPPSGFRWSTRTRPWPESLMCFSRKNRWKPPIHPWMINILKKTCCCGVFFANFLDTPWFNTDSETKMFTETRGNSTVARGRMTPTLSVMFVGFNHPTVKSYHSHNTSNS